MEALAQCRIAVDGDVTLQVRVGGEGPPLLLLHGYPQTHWMWHRLAPALARTHTLICPDLRGYGDSDKPPGETDHANYSKRRMAADMVALLDALGHPRCAVVGHDRGARVAHRLMLDHPQRIDRGALLDIVPTRHVFHSVNQAMATAYHHWFFLIQPNGLPERMIGAEPQAWLDQCLGGWRRGGEAFDPQAMAEYRRCFADPAMIHASCEDYRAAAGIDLVHDEADAVAGRRISCPLQVLWGAEGFVGQHYDVLRVWRDYADTVGGEAVAGGHFLAEENPADTLAALQGFLA